MSDAPGSALDPPLAILVLDDEEAYRASISRTLRSEGYTNVVSLGDPGEARKLVASGRIGIVLLDLHMPLASGEELQAEFAISAPQVPIIIVTGSVDSETIIRCMKAGALDYLVKPFEAGRLLAAVKNGLAIVELKRELVDFRERMLGGLERPAVFDPIVTADDRMTSLFKYIEAVAPSRQPVLIVGETGTGKELFARAVHESSGRKGAFVAVNVAGLDDSVFTDTLFGHKKGAYTGADIARQGLVSEAKGGTLFLDEIGDLDARSQVKLLRLLQEGEYYPLGFDYCLRSDARIVAATTKDLRAAAPAFRSDLFYRLQTHLVEIPPLRKRRGDIGILIDHFVRLSAESLGRKEPPGLSPAGREALLSYDYPGNVRELQAILHDAVAGANGNLVAAEAILARLPAKPAVPASQAAAQSAARHAGDEPRAAAGELLRIVGDRFPTFKEAEAELLRMAMSRANGNISLAASMLGVSRQTVYKWLAEAE